MIYAYRDLNPDYDGLLKVGYTEKDVDRRVAQQYPTKRPDGKLPYEILYRSSAMREDGSCFTDHDVHRMLRRRKITGVGGEWFRCTVDELEAAVLAVKTDTINEENRTRTFSMRPEQEEAVNKTIAYFRSAKLDTPDRAPKFLWNAKMRFGKTFAAYELARLHPDLKITALDQGRDIYHRSCPIVAGKVKECIHCPVCDTMCGFGGAGAFSDGKFNFTTQFGGWLTDFMDAREVMELIDYVDSINVAHGATTECFSTSTPEARALERRALAYDLHLLQARCKHLGTENNLRILQNIYEGLKDKLEFRFNTPVTHIAREGEDFRLTLGKGEELSCRWLIAAPGRSGAEWFAEECKGLGIHLINNQVDIGVRVELPAQVFEHITDVVYESKLVYRTKGYGDQVRTFCMNPYGHVVAENVEGINTVNGHSYADPKLRSENTNFALLVSNRFTQPFNEPYRYGKHIASLSNMLAGGVLVQRFGDLVKGVRTNEHRLGKSFTRPTLTAAVPGDLSLALPKRQLDDIIEMIYVLDKIAPGTANHDTLLYGAEVKFYSSRLELSGELETSIPGFFAAGDGAGVTRGLAQAGASGVQAARAISRRISQQV